MWGIYEQHWRTQQQKQSSNNNNNNNKNNNNNNKNNNNNTQMEEEEEEEETEEGSLMEETSLFSFTTINRYINRSNVFWECFQHFPFHDIRSYLIQFMSTNSSTLNLIKICIIWGTKDQTIPFENHQSWMEIFTANHTNTHTSNIISVSSDKTVATTATTNHTSSSDCMYVEMHAIEGAKHGLIPANNEEILPIVDTFLLK
jgi:hypothetical protein